eukprot:TRINITY_DN640_c0_g1_i4.p1 TRINITY_DN640_c0_g1~~TRINITY_DN640_c0_g1_i4.p1  ORF type:complete len:211 (-),score=32.66 TRINITY_DN640_c0_g1_i4:421-1053(-)
MDVESMLPRREPTQTRGDARRTRSALLFKADHSLNISALQQADCADRKLLLRGLHESQGEHRKIDSPEQRQRQDAWRCAAVLGGNARVGAARHIRCEESRPASAWICRQGGLVVLSALPKMEHRTLIAVGVAVGLTTLAYISKHLQAETLRTEYAALRQRVHSLQEQLHNAMHLASAAAPVSLFFGVVLDSRAARAAAVSDPRNLLAERH